MNRLERNPDMETVFLEALSGFQSKLWTALPAIVTKYDPEAMTVEVQPAIQGRQFSLELQDFESITMPLVVDVPVVFPSGGGFTLTFPIAEGDEVLLVISSRCIDAWWQSGGVQPQAIFAMHDLSDGFAIPGPKSQPRVISGVSTDSVQLRSDDGNSKVEVQGDTINIETTATVHLDAASIVLGASALKLINENFKTLFNTHIHGNVQGGPSFTGVPNVLMDNTMLTTKTKAE